MGELPAPLVEVSEVGVDAHRATLRCDRQLRVVPRSDEICTARERDRVPVERAQFRHALHQRMTGVVGPEVREAEGDPARRVVRRVTAVHEATLEQPGPSGVPGERRHNSNATRVFVVCEHVTHRVRVEPGVVREREHDLVVEQLLERRR